MKAKDTVIHNDGCPANGYITGGSLGEEKFHYDCTCGRAEQAEISFKAGIKEVTDWIDANEPYWRSVSTTKRDYYIPLSLADTWQAKLKEWGIDEV